MWKPGDNAPGKKKAGKASKKSRKRQRQEPDKHADRSNNSLGTPSSPPSQSDESEAKPASTTPKPLSSALSSLRFMSRVTDRAAREKEEKKAEHEERWVVPRNVLLGGVGADGASKLTCELATESDALAQVDTQKKGRRSFGGFREMIRASEIAKEIKSRKAGGGPAAGSNGRYHSTAGSSKDGGGDKKRQRLSSGGKQQLAKGSKKPAAIKKSKKKVGKLKRFKHS